MFIAPARIPDRIAAIREDAAPAAIGLPPAGVPFSTGTSAGSSLIESVMERPVAPPPMARKPERLSGPIHTGGRVQAAKLIKQVIPAYPVLAKTARVSGTVRLQGIIGRDGTIQNLQLISGPPLLVQAALEAVRQWVYKPTLLNGEAVEVIAPIDVVFTLN